MRPCRMSARRNSWRWTTRCEALEKINPRGSKVVELRYFGGMNNKEAAEVLRISETTVERDWRLAKAWLYRELQAR